MQQNKFIMYLATVILLFVLSVHKTLRHSMVHLFGDEGEILLLPLSHLFGSSEFVGSLVDQSRNTPRVKVGDNSLVVQRKLFWVITLLSNERRKFKIAWKRNILCFFLNCVTV